MGVEGKGCLSPPPPPSLLRPIGNSIGISLFHRVLTFVGGHRGYLPAPHLPPRPRPRPYMEQAACKFYEGLAEKAMGNCHVVDILACSLDQIGLLEMKVIRVSLLFFFFGLLG